MSAAWHTGLRTRYAWRIGLRGTVGGCAPAGLDGYAVNRFAVLGAVRLVVPKRVDELLQTGIAGAVDPQLVTPRADHDRGRQVVARPRGHVDVATLLAADPRCRRLVDERLAVDERGQCGDLRDGQARAVGDPHGPMLEVVHGTLGRDRVGVDARIHPDGIVRPTDGWSDGIPDRSGHVLTFEDAGLG